jgi:hypothetical protein
VNRSAGELGWAEGFDTYDMLVLVYRKGGFVVRKAVFSALEVGQSLVAADSIQPRDVVIRRSKTRMHMEPKG